MGFQEGNLRSATSALLLVSHLKHDASCDQDHGSELQQQQDGVEWKEKHLTGAATNT